jgi:hypothetical protein
VSVVVWIIRAATHQWSCALDVLSTCLSSRITDHPGICQRLYEPSTPPFINGHTNNMISHPSVSGAKNVFWALVYCIACSHLQSYFHCSVFSNFVRWSTVGPRPSVLHFLLIETVNEWKCPRTVNSRRLSNWCGSAHKLSYGIAKILLAKYPRDKSPFVITNLQTFVFV